MRAALTMLALALVGCGRPPASLDDEADESTSTGESSTSESSSSDADEASTLGDEGLSFVPGDGPDLPENCDPIGQDCPEGEKCVPYTTSGGSWDSNKCVPVTGDQHVGEPCHWDGIIEATDDCDATSLCWNAMEVDGELIGECVPFCTGTADEPECPDGWSCAVMSEGSTAHCEEMCDPLQQDCGDGFGCFWATTFFACIFTAGEIPTGEPCGYINDCAPGNLCMSSGELADCAGSACCTIYCDLDLGDSQCGVVPGTACMPFFQDEPAPGGYEDVGICILPP